MQRSYTNTQIVKKTEYECTSKSQRKARVYRKVPARVMGNIRHSKNIQRFCLHEATRVVKGREGQKGEQWSQELEDAVNGELVFNGDLVSVVESKKALETDGRRAWLHNSVGVFNSTKLYT